MYRSEYNDPPVWAWTAAIYTAKSGSGPARAGCATRCEDNTAKRRPKRPFLPLIVKNLFCVFPALVAQRSILFGLLFLLGSSQFASAQNDPTERLGYGATLHFVRTTHAANFDSLPGIPEARERFTSGLGNGIAVGTIIRLPLQPSLALAIHGHFTMYKGAFSALQQEPVAPGGEPIPSTIQHTVDASFGQLTILPMIDFSPIERLHLTAGPEAGMMLYNTVTQKEEIIAPAGATWVETGTPVQTLFDGTLNGVGRWQAALTVGAGYTFPVPGSRTLSVTPELLISFPLTQLYPEGNWSATVYRAGISLLFTPLPPPVPVLYDTVRTRDTLVRIVAGLEREQIVQDSSTVRTEQIRRAEDFLVRTFINETYVRQIPELKPLLSAGVGASFVLEDGRETRAAKVTMEEFIVNKYIPLLPYIFFDEGAAALPERYTRISIDDSRSFDINQYNKLSTLDTYRQLLNIVGQRMRANSQAILRLTGYTAGEKGGTTLSGQRAETIAAYLSSVWNIPSSRLVINARQLPERPSPMLLPEGTEENRRVEMSSNDPLLFAPVVLTDTIRTVDPPTVRFRTRLFSEAGIQHWSILITQQEKPLKELHGKGSVPPLVDWPIGMDDIRPAASIPLAYRLAVTDSSGQSFFTPENSILFEQLTISKKKLEHRADKVIDRFSLLLFDYDASTLSERHETTLSFIRRRLQPQSTVRIVGTTDKLGEEEYNRLLSQRRAQETAQALAVPNTFVTGAGEDIATYSNDVPEGRFYSRTVRITIETPVTGQPRQNE